jgi:hypothetical protein
MAGASTRGIACIAGALALILSTASADAEPGAGDLLDAQRTRAALESFIGRPPAHCIASGAGLDLCEWRLGNRDPAWASLAAAIDTAYRLNVLCEIPSDGSARAQGSCSVHPRRSERSGWAVPNLHPNRRGESTVSERRAARERLALRAEAALAKAETLIEISRLVGAAPDQCRSQGPGTRTCLWRATSQTQGHAILAAGIAAPKRKKVRLECRLPADGSARRADSCKVEIGT